MGNSKNTRILKRLFIGVLVVLTLSWPMPWLSTQAKAASVNLALLPASQTVKAGDSFSVAVQAHCNGQETDAIAIFLDFDPGDIEVQSIAPGETLDIILQNSYDNVLGTIDFGAGKLTPPYPSDSFTLATLTFKLKLDAVGLTTDLSFHNREPRSTGVDHFGTMASGNPLGAVINIGHKIPSNPAGNSPIPATPKPIELTLIGLNSLNSLVINRDGTIQNEGKLKTPDNRLFLQIKANTKLLDAGGLALSRLEVEVDNSSPPAPEGAELVTAYRLSPEGAKFDPPLTLSLNYDPAELSENVTGQGLYWAYFNSQGWQNLAGKMDTQAKTVGAEISSSGFLAILGDIKPDSVPAASPIPLISPTREITSPPSGQSMLPSADPITKTISSNVSASVVKTTTVPASNPPTVMQTNWILIAGIMWTAVLILVILVIRFKRKK